MRTIALVMFLYSFSLVSCGSLEKRVMTPRGSEHTETLVVFAFNDFHGALAPQKLKTEETANEKGVEYTVGGAAVLASHVRLLRKQLGPNLLIMTAGDDWQGTIDSNLEEGAPVVKVYNSIGVDAATIGNHEFDYGSIGDSGTPGDLRGALKVRLSEAKYPYVSANIREKATGKPLPLPNTTPSLLIERSGIKVGVIGITTENTSTTTRSEFVSDLRFDGATGFVLSEAKALREKGAEIVVLLAHAGLNCDLKKSVPNGFIRATWTATSSQGTCPANDEIPTIIKMLPKGTIDLVIAGHTHMITHHWVNGVPVIQAGASGLYYNLIHLPYDRVSQRLLTNQVKIDGPIPVCEKIFSNLGHCNGKLPPPPEGRGELVKPSVFEETIEPDEIVADLLEETFKKNEEPKKRVVGTAVRPVTHTRVEESELGNLVADALRARVKADVALVNPGAIRTNIETGPITYADVFAVVPFDNTVSLLEVTGRELKNILRVAYSGARGIFSTSGFRITLRGLKDSAPSKDLNGDGKISHWEVDRMLSAQFADGKPINDKKLYKLATMNFLVTGGDDMGWAMFQVPKNRITLDAGGMIQEAVVSHVQTLGAINSAEKPLIDPKKPRIIIKSMR